MDSGPRRLQVLMATYNGAAYLTAQLASLKAQTVAQEIQLLIRDDGSTDATLDLIREFDPGPLSLDVITGDHIGVIASFRRLLDQADPACQAILFCDQDDVWRPEKAEAAAAALALLDPACPGLYCGRSVVTDANLNPVGLIDSAPRGPSWRNALVQNISPGHTMALNPALARLVADTLDPATAIMHDNWTYAVAAGLGQVVFDPEPHAPSTGITRAAKSATRSGGGASFNAWVGSWRSTAPSGPVRRRV